MATNSSVLAWRIPGTGGAWWAAVYGVAQSRTQLKGLSSSSNKHMQNPLIIHLASSRTQLANTKMPNSCLFAFTLISEHEV